MDRDAPRWMVAADEAARTHEQAPAAESCTRTSPLIRQRLWVLKRCCAREWTHGICRFTSAFAVLGGTGVYVFFVRSIDARLAEGRPLGCAVNVERNARRFRTLDAALDWADTMRGAWLSQGWRDVAVDGDDR